MTAAENVEPNIEWTKIGPFNVQVESASKLTYTLFVMGFLCIGLLIWALLMTMMGNAKTKMRVAAALGKFRFLGLMLARKKTVSGANKQDAS